MTAAYWDASPWFVKLGVRLLDEQRKGTASPFSQWIQQLPQQVHRHAAVDMGSTPFLVPWLGLFP